MSIILSCYTLISEKIEMPTINKKKNFTLALMNQISTLKTPPPSKKKSKSKSKKNKKKGTLKKNPARVKGFASANSQNNDNSNMQARIGDKTRSARSFQDLGLITDFDNRKKVWITNMGRELYPSKQDKSWEIVYYRIYVLSLRPKPIRRRKYLPEGWPFNTSPSIVDRSNNSFTDATSNGTNQNNVDLRDRRSYELESTEINNNYSNNNGYHSEGDYDDRKLYMCVVSAPTPEIARQFIIDNDLFGIEDLDEDGKPYENSIWLDEYLSSCKDVGESFHQKLLLLCINRY